MSADREAEGMEPIELSPEYIARTMSEDPIGWMAGVLAGMMADGKLEDAALLVSTLDATEARGLALRLARNVAALVTP